MTDEKPAAPTGDDLSDEQVDKLAEILKKRDEDIKKAEEKKANE